MPISVYELGLEAIAELVTYALGTLLLTGLGLFVERSGLALLISGGVSVTGVWLVGVGAILLYAGLAYCGQRFVATVRHRDG